MQQRLGTSSLEINDVQDIEMPLEKHTSSTLFNLRKESLEYHVSHVRKTKKSNYEIEITVRFSVYRLYEIVVSVLSDDKFHAKKGREREYSNMRPPNSNFTNKKNYKTNTLSLRRSQQFITQQD